MRRLLIAAGLVGTVSMIAVVIGLRPGVKAADAPRPNVDPAPAATANLPIAKVILYSSGVGYFQREGKVHGNARIDLSFPVQDINDLLKSMVLRDRSGGHVSAVSYDSQAPVERTLKSFAINLNDNPGFAQILQQARGEKVEVVLQQSNATQPGTVTGSIIGVERIKQPVSKDAVIDVEQLNLWCAEGMRSVKLAEVQRLRFLNPVMESEVRKALETLARSHDTQKKAVSINFAGEGNREVSVGYVIENPIWKTSYRLVLGKDGKPFLQGWAIVENPSDEDWTDVGMVLVSGRPISFQMDLYQPHYVPRPVVVPELFASLRPPAYESSMANGYLQVPNPTSVLVPQADRVAALMERNKVAYEEGKYKEAEMYASAALEIDPSSASASAALKMARIQANSTTYRKGKEQREKMFMRIMDDAEAEGLPLADSVRAAATAGQLGDFFQYAIDRPVNLGRQKSAMLPIINKDVEGERVSIYNPATHEKFPLLGLKFKNTSGLHLMQGPITVFDGSAYAGDARVMDVQPGEERLISFAVDLGMEVAPVVEVPRRTLTKVKAVKGIIHATSRVVESKTYKVANRSDTDRTLLIEHPFRADFKITSKEQPAETTRDAHRFKLMVGSKKDASLTVVEERDEFSQVVLSNADDDTIRHFVTSGVSGKALQEALTKSLQLKGQAELTRQELVSLDQELQDLERDQKRIRDNLAQTPPATELHKKYLDKLTAQEAEVDRFRDKIKSRRADELSRTREYQAFLAALDVE